MREKSLARCIRIATAIVFADVGAITSAVAWASILVSLVACGAPAEEPEGEASVGALGSTCGTPRVATESKTDANGKRIDGSAHATLRGCIAGKRGESGSALLARATAVLGDTTRIGRLEDANAVRVFSAFVPAVPSGTLETSLIQNVDVALNVDHTPGGTLRVERRLRGDVFTMRITNGTAFKASVVFIPVEVIKPGNMSLDVELRAVDGGIEVSGTTDIILQREKEKAAETAQLVASLFDWLAGELD